jgi:hypothetical protein
MPTPIYYNFQQRFNVSARKAFEWCTSTHISGPAKHSQFIYQITAESDNISSLDFTGLFIDYGDKKMSESDIAKLAEKICKEDAGTWVLLSKAMEQELC